MHLQILGYFSLKLSPKSPQFSNESQMTPHIFFDKCIFRQFFIVFLGFQYSFFRKYFLAFEGESGNTP